MKEEKFYKEDLIQETKKLNNSKIITFPLPYGEKTPKKGESWLKKNYDLFDLEEELKAHPVNIGIKCGSFSINLVCLDFDSMGLFDHIYKTNSKFQYIVDHTHCEKTSRGIHVYIRTPEEVKGQALTDLDVKSWHSCVVHAPSYNAKSGTYYQTIKGFNPSEDQYYIYTLESFDEIDFIDLTKNKNGISTIIRTRPIMPKNDPITGTVDPLFMYRQLHTKYKEILRNNLPVKYYKKFKNGKIDITSPDRSKADSALCLVLVKNGYEYIDCKALYDFISEDNKYLERKRQGNHESYLKTTFDNAERYYFEKRSKFDEKIDHLFYIMKFHNPFEGRSKTTRKLLIMSLLYKMKLSGRSQVDFSIREFEIYTGLSNKAVIKNLSDLQSEGLILHFNKKESIVYSDSYMLNFEEITKLLNIHHIFTCPDKKEMSNIHHIFTFLCLTKGKGKVEYRLKYRDIQSLSEDQHDIKALNRNSDILIQYINKNLGKNLTMNDLLDVTGLTRNTIKEKLDKLKSVIEIEEGKKKTRYSTKHLKTYIFKEALTADKLEQLTIISGSKGNQAKREKRIQQERQAYRNFVASIEDIQNQKKA